MIIIIIILIITIIIIMIVAIIILIIVVLVMIVIMIIMMMIIMIMITISRGLQVGREGRRARRRLSSGPHSIHPIPITRFRYFQTQPLENLSAAVKLPFKQSFWATQPLEKVL